MFMKVKNDIKKNKIIQTLIFMICCFLFLCAFYSIKKSYEYFNYPIPGQIWVDKSVNPFDNPIKESPDKTYLIIFVSDGWVKYTKKIPLTGVNIAWSDEISKFIKNKRRFKGLKFDVDLYLKKTKEMKVNED